MEDRVILHSDLNSFYASVEMMLDPSLRGKAVAVCGSTEDRHGIVLAKSDLAKKAGIKWGYHNHSNEFKRVLKAGEQPDPKANPWQPQGTYIEELFLKNTDPDKVMFELDVYWTVMGQQDPIEWLENYPDRFKLLHIKDRWIIGASGMMNFANIFKKAYENKIIGYYVELEGDRKGRPQFLGVEESAKYLQSASFVK